jgi:hypothetical protein
MLENVHFDCPISSSANDFVCDKVNAVDFVSVARQVRFEFVCFEVPDLPKKNGPLHQQKCSPSKTGRSSHLEGAVLTGAHEQA